MTSRRTGGLRILVATTAGAGHFGPLVPLAAACAAAGHEIRVAAPASFRSAVEAAGFEHAAFADVDPEVMGQTFARLPSLSREEANRLIIAEVFGRLDAQAALPGVRSTIEAWRPDLVLREPCEFGSLAAACALQVPHATVAIGVQAMNDAVAGLVADSLRELDERAGLATGTCEAAVAGATTFSSVPPLLDGPGAEVHRYRDAHEVAGAADLPATWGDPEAPLVYVSFGSVAASQPRFLPLYRAVLDVVADQPVRVLLTTGQPLGDDVLGAVPANTHVEPWWPQQAALRHASAVVGHGGFGTTMGAVAAGLPQVVVPLFSMDQFLNAKRVAAVGAGVTVEPEADRLPGLPAALRDVLEDARYHDAAQALAAEVAALPDTHEVAGRLESLAG